MKQFYLAFLMIILVFTACQTNETNHFTYEETEIANDWFMGNGASEGIENDYKVFVLKGKHTSFMNYRTVKSDFSFSGEVRFEKSIGDSWCAIQWGVPQIDGSAGDMGGYFLLIRLDDSSCHLFKGPWTPEIKTMYDGFIEKIGKRYVKFRIEKKDLKTTIYIDEIKMYEFSDPNYSEGFLGLYTWSNRDITAVYRNVKVE